MTEREEKFQNRDLDVNIHLHQLLMKKMPPKLQRKIQNIQPSLQLLEGLLK